jgi:hypothetical protein
LKNIYANNMAGSPIKAIKNLNYSKGVSLIKGNSSMI